MPLDLRLSAHESVGFNRLLPKFLGLLLYIYSVKILPPSRAYLDGSSTKRLYHPDPSSSCLPPGPSLPRRRAWEIAVATLGPGFYSDERVILEIRLRVETSGFVRLLCRKQRSQHNHRLNPRHFDAKSTSSQNLGSFHRKQN